MNTYNLILKKQQEIDLILKENSKNDEEKIKIFEKALKINNTKKDLVLEYLLLLKKKYRDNINNITIFFNALNLYINHMPKDEFNNYFSEYIEKKHSSIEKIYLVFDIIQSQDWSKCDYNKRKNCLLLLLNHIKENQKEIDNTSPITWENKELYIYFLFQKIVSKINNRIEAYKKIDNIESKKLNECKNNLKKMRNDMKEMKYSQNIYDMGQLIKKTEEKKEYICIIEGNFFKLYLKNFMLFLQIINKNYLKDLTMKKFDSKEEKETFEYIILYISNTDFENFNSLGYWKLTFKDSTNEENQKIIEEYNNKDEYIQFDLNNKNELIVKFTFDNTSEKIENIQDYILSNVCDDICKTGEINYNSLINFVKIHKLNNHLYIKSIYNDWKTFNKCIFSSKTIKTLYNSLFVNQIDLIEEIDNILDNIIYFNFETDFKGLTDRKILKIYEYGLLTPRSNFKIKNNIDLSKTIYLAFCQIINNHEILGNFNVGYQNYNTHKKKVFTSPSVTETLGYKFAKDRGWYGPGENIEIQLYGRVIFELTLKEALFILNYNNYRCDYKEFRKNFEKCNNEKLVIDDFLITILNIFKINPKRFQEEENTSYLIDKNAKKYVKENKIKKGKHPIGFDFDGKFNISKEQIEHAIELIKELD